MLNIIIEGSRTPTFNEAPHFVDTAANTQIINIT